MRRNMSRRMDGNGIRRRPIVHLTLAGIGVIACGFIVAVMLMQSERWPSDGESRSGGSGNSPIHRGSMPDSAATEGPLHGVHVVVDAGHGGHDRGACHFPSALIEKEINLDMAVRLEAALQQSGAKVSLTRRDDTFVSLDDRARFANEHDADLFISLHVNRYPSADCFGAQTFYSPASEEGRRLALLIQEELLEIYPPNYRQALPGDFRVLRNTHMAATLVEIGFVTSPVDRELMAQANYREQVVAAIVEACIRFVRGELAAS